MVAEFAKRQIDYFHSLPESLKGAETVRNGALAMVHLARAKRVLGNPEEALKTANEAIGLLERARSSGDGSEATLIALASAYACKAQTLDNQNDPAGPATLKRAANLLAPLVESPNASAGVRRAYVEVLVRMGFEQSASNQNEEAARTEKQAMRLAAGLGALDLTNLEMSALYAEGGAWLVTALINAGHDEESVQVGRDANAIADKVLELRPGYRLALHAEQVILSNLSGVAVDFLNPAEGQRFAEHARQVSITLLNLDPNNTTSANNLGVADVSIASTLWSQGKLRESIPWYRAAVEDLNRAARGGTGFTLVRAYNMADTANRLTMMGDLADADALVIAGIPFLEKVRTTSAPGSLPIVVLEASQVLPAAYKAYERDDLVTASRLGLEAEQKLRGAKPEGGHEELQKEVTLYLASLLLTRVEYARGDYAAAEKFARQAYDSRKFSGSVAVLDIRELGEVATWLAMALAREGKLAEAAETIAPVIKHQREFAARNHGDEWLALELGAALYAQALADSSHRAALTKEATALLNKLPPSMRDLHDLKLWRTRIQQTAAGSAG